MARPARTGGKRSAVKTRKASSAKDRTRDKTKRPARLKRSTASDVELKEAREQQAATAEILQVISQSAFDLQAVLETLVSSAVRLCDADTGIIRRRKGDLYPVAATFGFTDEERNHFGRYSVKPDRGSVFGRAILERRSIHVPDLLADPHLDRDRVRDYARAVTIRTGLGVPLLRDGTPIGVFTLQRRKQRPYTKKQIELVETFANQAVIAIENTRLFEEVQAKTRNLEGSLQQQTATANVLKVISRSAFDLLPVFDVIAENAVSLCEAERAFIFRYDGQVLRAVAHCNAGPEVQQFVYQNPVAPGRHSISARAALERRTIHVADVQADPDYHYALRDVSPIRTILAVPMLKGDELVGVIASYRLELKPFSNDQITLLETFADQAVIAIENARLFNETTEALERQTATADILKVIASSPDDVQPVFEAIAERSNRLVNGLSTAVYSIVDDVQHLMAFTPISESADAALKAFFPAMLSTIIGGETIRKGEIFRIADIENEPVQPSVRDMARLRGWRSLVLVPLLRDNKVIGQISVTRKEPGSFAAHHVQLLQTFADQAVIAIENARLFNEVQAKTRNLTEALEQQTATSEILQVISSSQGELDPVFTKLLENATRVCGASFGTMNLYENDEFRQVARYNVPNYGRPEVIRPHPESALATAARTRRVVQIEDIRAGAPYREGAPEVQLMAAAGARTLFVVPMLRGDELLGTITIYRQEVRLFTDQQIELVANFARQAVIAIENARLLNELRQRTEDLTTSLDELRAAQDRLIQTEKLASLGQLTAGIAHEIKNPLNFVNNFSALSAELVDEMTEVLENPEVDEKSRRRELDEIRELLKSNLEKVVQHGKRADSIVKNMLLHSREGSGERRPVEINAIIDESLNLAYHGARAEKAGFNITLQRAFDPGTGMADVYPQEITRVLLNLISNGFYAATRRAAETGGGFEPTLQATTKNLGDKIEIRIRDNGTGISSDIKEKIFNPFFTTKPAGEGTGLGLSMSHDIIVKQHGGTIHVDTEPGEFTEFVVTLPRATSAQKPAGSAN